MPDAYPHDGPGDPDDGLTDIAEQLLENLRTNDAPGIERLLSRPEGEVKLLGSLRPAMEILVDMKAGAIREWEEAARLQPKLPDPHVNLAMAYLELKKLAEAVVESRLAIQLEPRNPNPHSILGLALLDQDTLDESAAELRRAVDLDPNHPARRRDLAACLEKQGKSAEAAVESSKASDLDGEDSDPGENRAE